MECNINKTSDIVVIPRVNRKKTSIWIDGPLWDGFVKKVHKQGHSTCNVLEPFIYAYMQGTPDHPTSILPKVEVNLTIQRIVQRPRRYFNRDIPDFTLTTEGSRSSCADCGEEPDVLVTVIHSRDRRQESFVCAEHFFRIRDLYDNIYWKDLKKYTWRKGRG